MACQRQAASGRKQPKQITRNRLRGLRSFSWWHSRGVSRLESRSAHQAVTDFLVPATSELGWQSHRAATLPGRDDQAGGSRRARAEGITSTTKRGTLAVFPRLAVMRKYSAMLAATAAPQTR